MGLVARAARGYRLTRPMVAPRLIAITDTTLVAVDALLIRARKLCGLCRPKSVMLQLRDRELGIRERLDLGQQLAEVAREFDQLFCVNDRLDLARLLDAKALHLGESSVSAHDVRRLEGDRFWLTRASHDPSSCQAEGADAVLLSPILAPRKGTASLGLGAITTACASSGVPIYALGGVSADTAASCVAAGATGVAVIGAWLATESLEPLINFVNSRA